MILFVHLGHQVLSVCIEFKSLIPIAFAIGGADSVHFLEQVDITCETLDADIGNLDIGFFPGVTQNSRPMPLKTNGYNTATN